MGHSQDLSFLPLTTVPPHSTPTLICRETANQTGEDHIYSLTSSHQSLHKVKNVLSLDSSDRDSGHFVTGGPVPLSTLDKGVLCQNSTLLILQSRLNFFQPPPT